MVPIPTQIHGCVSDCIIRHLPRTTYSFPSTFACSFSLTDNHDTFQAPQSFPTPNYPSQSTNNQHGLLRRPPPQYALDAFSALDADTEPPVTASGLSSATMDLLRSAQQNQKPAPKMQRKSSGMDYLFKLTSPITPAILASAAILSSQPRIVDGESEDGVAQFCLVDEGDVAKIKRWLTATYPSISPVFAPMNKARKSLSPYSAYPTLGLDTTLPQHRPSTSSEFRPSQNQYPVWYFFYATLANASILARLFSLPPDEIPVLVPARIHGDAIRTWAGKYNALVDCPGSQVSGLACEVQ
jgi:hypothetical protein